MANPSSLTDSVSKTLFIPLWAKAQEITRPGGILRDAEAARVVAMLPKETFDFPKKKPMMIGSVVRARHFDDIAVKALTDDQAVLVHLGCGLDNRFGRTDKGQGIQINIDLPDVMKLRDALMPSKSDRNIDWAGSLLETDWMDRLLATWPGARYTFFMEGLLMYFGEEEVRNLFVNIAERFPGAGLHFDACDSRMCELVGKQQAIRRTAAVFKWGMEDERILEDWDRRLRLEKITYYFDIFRKRWGWLSLMRFFPRFARGSKMLSYRVTAR